MPLAFAGSAGGMLLLTGSPVNVVISEAAGDAGVGTFGFAEFALVGVPLVVGTVLVVMTFGQRLLPHRTSGAQAPDLSGHAATLVSHYSLDDVFHLRVQPGSALIGSARDTWDDLQAYEGLNVITVLDGESHQAVSDGVVGRRRPADGRRAPRRRTPVRRRLRPRGRVGAGLGRRRAGDPQPRVRGRRGRRTAPVAVRRGAGTARSRAQRSPPRARRAATGPGPRRHHHACWRSATCCSSRATGAH